MRSPTQPSPSARLDGPLAEYIHRDITPLRAHQTVADALTFLRAQQLGERIVYFYVVDDEERLVGVVPTRRLLMAPSDTTIERIMAPKVFTIPDTATVRDAFDLFLKQRLLALPVVDAQGRLVGVADVALATGDVSARAEQERESDVFQLIGAHVTQGSTAVRGFLDRFPWLLCNVGGGLIAAAIAGFYSSLLNAVIVLALFMPAVLAVSESVGMQSVTLTLQSFHGKRVDWPFLLKSARRELATALLLGAACGIVIGAVAWLWTGAPRAGAAIAVSVTLAMGTAALLGVVLPGTLRATGRDPRIASGPVVLALTDFVTLIFYFNAAGWLYGGVR